MAFKPTEKQAKALEARGSVYRMETLKRPKLDANGEKVYLKDKDGNLTRDFAWTDPVVVCRITDTVTGRLIAKAEAPSDEEAFAKALAAAHDSPMPKTPAEIESENVKLKRRIAQLEAERADPKDAVPDPDDERSDPSPSAGGEDNSDDTLESLREEAEMLGIHVDRRWGERRLREEIAAAEADGKAEIASKMPPAAAE